MRAGIDEGCWSRAVLAHGEFFVIRSVEEHLASLAKVVTAVTVADAERMASDLRSLRVRARL